VAISYAHGDDRSEAGRMRGRVVDELVPRLEAWGYRALRDQDALRNGDLIREFMLRLGRAERVVVVLSDKYLRSVYCMSELHYAFQFALGQPGRFAARVVPLVLDDAQIDDWRARKAWAEHWEAEYRAMDAGHHHLGAQDRALCLQIRRWHADVGDMLSLVADLLAPRGYAAIAADDYRAVREMLDRPVVG
jgi:internalin A